MAQVDTRPPEGRPVAQRRKPPSVLVVLVAKDGAPWLRQCLLALSRQTHPRLGVMAVDNASTDGSADLLATTLGQDRVLRLARNEGFAGAVNRALATDLAREADYVLLLHDDALLAPDAISRMVEAAERVDGTGVVGPKLLDWHRPELLRGIGMSSDRFGYAYSPLEEGEIDHGQYDRMREVLYVPSCAMLVARNVWNRIGPPDDRLASRYEDLDFCWRARLAGFRVLMAPNAVVRHRSATAEGERPAPEVVGRDRYLRERAAMLGILKNYSLLSILLTLPVYLAFGLARVLVLTLTRRFEEAYQVLAAWGWNARNLPGTVRRRVRAQAVRTVRDRELRRLMAPAGIRLRRWAMTATQALFPGHVAEAEPLRFRTRLARLALAHPVATAWLAAAVIALLAYRNLLWRPELAGGAWATFPDRPSDLFRELVSGVRTTGLGGTAAASPALGLLGLASVLTFSSPPLLGKLLLLALPAAAGAAAYYVIRSATGNRAASALGGAVYATSAVMLWAVSGGRLGALVFLAGLPWLSRKLLEVFDVGMRVPPPRWIAGAGLGIAALFAFFPGTLLALAVIVAASLLVPPSPERRLAALPWVAGGVGVAVLLSFPFVLEQLGSGFAAAGGVRGAPSLGVLGRLVPALGPGWWILAWLLPATAGAALVFVSDRLLRPALWGAVVAVIGVALAWAGAAGYLPEAMTNVGAFIGLASFACVFVASIALAECMGGLGRAFGHRQLGTVLLSSALLVVLLGQAVEAVKGRWTVGGPDRIAAVYPLVAGSADQPYRVLWLGGWRDDLLPPPAGAPDGRVAAGTASVTFAIGSPAGESIADVGRPAAGGGYRFLREALLAILDGSTRHGGAMLAPLGVRFVLAERRQIPPAALASLFAQVDLDIVPAEGMIIFRNPKAAPTAAAIASPGWTRLSGRSSPRGVAELPVPAATVLRGAGPELRGSADVAAGSIVLLSQEFDDRWRLSGDATALEPVRMFGWAVGFRAAQAVDAPYAVGFTGQRPRTVVIALLAILWLVALWLVRRPARRGRWA